MNILINKQLNLMNIVYFDVRYSNGRRKLCGILQVLEEANRVRTFQDANPSTLATFGCVEQNIFTPILYDNPSLNATALASMFRRSPLCVASLGLLKDGDVIGAHEDDRGVTATILSQAAGSR